jgi:hypothetical protein
MKNFQSSMWGKLLRCDENFYSDLIAGLDSGGNIVKEHRRELQGSNVLLLPEAGRDKRHSCPSNTTTFTVYCETTVRVDSACIRSSRHPCTSGHTQCPGTPVPYSCLA